MLAGNRYRSSDFGQALVLLRAIRRRPVNEIYHKFQDQFVNKKARSVLLIFVNGKYIGNVYFDMIYDIEY